MDQNRIIPTIDPAMVRWLGDRVTFYGPYPEQKHYGPFCLSYYYTEE